MNYFDSSEAAERYSRGRPFYHPLTIHKIIEFLGESFQWEKILDMACGTGLSSRALLETGAEIWAVDASDEMLQRAYKSTRIQYLQGSAEKLPFEESFFDIITVGSGVHWFEIDSFLKDSARVLKEKGWIILFENYFNSEMENVPEFNSWYSEVYKLKFPSPPRNTHYDYSDKNINSKGFRWVNQMDFKNSIQLTKEELILYFTTQSNIIASVEKGSLSYREAEIWLDTALSPYFQGFEKRTLFFGNWIKFLQKI